MLTDIDKIATVLSALCFGGATNMSIKREQIEIQSPHNVVLEYVAAGLGDRIIAYMIDIAFIVAYFIFLTIFLPEDLLEDILGVDNASVLRFLLYILPLFFYDLFMEYLMNGQTPGKKVMKIRVIRLDGEKPGLQHYSIRWAFRVVENVLVIFGIIPIISSAVTRRHQRLGDLAAGTTVIKADADMFFSTSILHNKINKYEPVFVDTSWATRTDIQLIYHLLHRVFTKFPDREREMVAEMASRIREVYGINERINDPRADMNDTVLLRTFAKDYNYNESREDNSPTVTSSRVRYRYISQRVSAIKEANDD